MNTPQTNEQVAQPQPTASTENSGVARSLFPELRIDDERLALWLAAVVGAITFTALMGWGPHGDLVYGRVGRASTAKPAVAAIELASREPNDVTRDRARTQPTVLAAEVRATTEIAPITLVPRPTVAPENTPPVNAPSTSIETELVFDPPFAVE